jgi:hypothetical protein
MALIYSKSPPIKCQDLNKYAITGISFPELLRDAKLFAFKYPVEV